MKHRTRVISLFTTKKFKYSVPQGLSSAAEIIKAAKFSPSAEDIELCYRPKQIHGKNIVVVTKKTETIFEADAVITNECGLFLSVATADCVPILMYDEKKRVIAAVHSGWRGTNKEIAKFCVYDLVGKFAVNPKDLQIQIGPSIRECCYEVSLDVANRFKQYGYITKGGKPYIDLASINRQMLINCGIKKDNIYISQYCTSCRSDLLYSWRKKKEDGRMYAVIGILF